MPLDYDVKDGVATLTFNRPDKLNAMDAQMYAQLSEVWRAFRDDESARVAIVTGAGDRSFTTGADLATFVQRDVGLADAWLTQKDQLLNRGLEIWKPVISAVNGYCLGGGMTLLLATDIRIAAAHATFGLTEVKRGILPGNGGTQRLLGQLPYPIAMEMLLTGETVDAEFAAKWGLVNKVVPLGELMPTATALAARIAANAPLAVQATKELALRSRDVDLATGLRLESVMSRLLKFTDDAKEGPIAFAERRRPKFEGR